ncbi:MAG: mevalonate kinase [Halobacteriales archaeon]|nr:mevalonate kinase [Halobacteriales archaeon]
MARSSAPGTAFLLGEHAVVYGEPALLFAVGRRATVTVETVNGGDNLPDSAYVREAVERAKDYAEDDTSLRVNVDSEIPIGAGLGSSAAVSAATLHAVSRELGTPMEREKVAEKAHAVELDVQGAASPADTYTTTMGGYTVVGDDEKRSLDVPEGAETRFVVGWDGGSAPTGEMVEGVSRLVDSNPVAGDIVESIGDLSRIGVERAEAGETDALAALMDMNHGLLDALGVSSSSLSRMVWAGRDAGGHAKLTGAGGAGCVVAYPANDDVLGAVAEEAEDAFVVGVAEGVRSEEE